MVYLRSTLENLSQVHVIGESANRVLLLSFTFSGVSSDKVVQRLADNGVRALAGVPSRALDVMGVNDFGGAVTIGLGPYSTPRRSRSPGPHPRLSADTARCRHR